MKLKDACQDRLRLEVSQIDGKLAVVLLDVDVNFPGQIITHIHRTQEEQDDIYRRHPNPEVRKNYERTPWPSVHQLKPVRGVDLRSGRDADEVAKHVNRRWQYDPERPGLQCAIVHDAGRGRHIHVQVHPRTVSRI